MRGTGECTANREYMAAECPRACRFCKPKPKAPPTTPSPLQEHDVVSKAKAWCMKIVTRVSAIRGMCVNLAGENMAANVLEELQGLAAKLEEKHMELKTAINDGKTLEGDYIQALQHLEDTPNALVALKKAVSLDPGDPMGHINMAVVLYQSGQLQEASKVLRDGETASDQSGPEP